MSKKKYATVRLTRDQLQAIYKKLWPDYRAEVFAPNAVDAPASPLYQAFVKIADAISDLDAECVA